VAIYTFTQLLVCMASFPQLQVLYGFFCAAGFCSTDLCGCIYFHTAPVTFFLQLLVLYGFLHTAGFYITDLFGYFYTALGFFGFFPMAPGFIWFLVIGFKFSDFLYFKQNFKAGVRDFK